MANLLDLGKLLRENAYPGRGIVLGRSQDGASMVAAYFIMGRSANSRNRIFVEEGEGIRTQAFDPSQLQDPSLIIYAPVRVCGDTTIVTNGDQTDTVYDYLSQGKSFQEALCTRTFEPDAPNYTPRISGILRGEGYQLSILKSLDGDPDYPRRQFFLYEKGKPGVGHFIHTYQGDGSPMPSFAGEPEQVALSGGIDQLTQQIWENLNPDNRVSLFVRYIQLDTGRWETRIVNKNA